MRLLIMGAPGAGKGTQAALIKEAYNIKHISTGDMFRKAISEKTPTGIEAKSYIDQGKLVPDSVTNKLVRERLSEKDCENGFLLDGYPRNLAQAEELDKILKDLGIKLDAVINVSVDDNFLIERITGRRTCTKCGASYHVSFNKPKVEGICDECGSTLIQRPDDSEETIKNRLSVYYEKTKPVLDYYEAQNIVKNVDGIGEINEIFEKIKKELGEF
ncbi:MAG: adenylate kinase [Coprobacillus sp.]|nr:adenylate kinase [Coprobacillus sp.]MDY4145942.1 adenylate kinase [Bacilli bacterium]OLA10957.1 MAG: adenylate kinase [Coprobacillus sp. 28_7]CCY08444.1 adenylate kinase [Coprobacillus sp. CAG:698]